MTLVTPLLESPSKTMRKSDWSRVLLLLVNALKSLSEPTFVSKENDGGGLAAEEEEEVEELKLSLEKEYEPSCRSFFKLYD